MDERAVRLDQSFERFTQFEESQHSFSGAVKALKVVRCPTLGLVHCPTRSRANSPAPADGPPQRCEQDEGGKRVPTVGQWNVAVHMPREAERGKVKVAPVIARTVATPYPFPCARFPRARRGSETAVLHGLNVQIAAHLAYQK
jgi:hypothetical protein